MSKVIKMSDLRPETIISDLDGTLIKHKGDITTQHLGFAELLPGVREKIIEWDRKGCKIILTTGRREGVRKDTEIQLSQAGIIYDQLIMGLGGGIRVLINDSKPNSNEETAKAITVERNAGLEGI